MSLTLAVDGYSVTHRCFHSMNRGEIPPAPDQVRGAVARMLVGLAERFHPDFLILTSEGGLTFRHSLSPLYKAGRRECPPELDESLAHLFDGLPRIGIPVISAPGFEADDVLATVAARTRPGHQLIIASSDRDLVACVRPGVNLWLIRSGGLHRLLTVKDAQEIFGVPPSRLAEFKALAGDRGDGIMGVPGIGPVGARGLLQQYPDWVSLQRAEGEDRCSRLLREHRGELQLSYQLATLRADLDFTLQPEPCRFDVHKLSRLREWAAARSQPEARSALELPGLDELLAGQGLSPREAGTPPAPPAAKPSERGSDSQQESAPAQQLSLSPEP